MKLLDIVLGRNYHWNKTHNKVSWDLCVKLSQFPNEGEPQAIKNILAHFLPAINACLEHEFFDGIFKQCLKQTNDTLFRELYKLLTYYYISCATRDSSEDDVIYILKYRLIHFAAYLFDDSKSNVHTVVEKFKELEDPSQRYIHLYRQVCAILNMQADLKDVLIFSDTIVRHYKYCLESLAEDKNG